MTRDERIMDGLVPVCEACGEYEETARERDWCHSPICDQCEYTGRHQEYHELLKRGPDSGYDDEDQT